MHPKPKRIVNKALLADFRARCCLVCGKTPCDPAHIKTRGSGGVDEEWNLLSLCRAHHTMQGSMGFYRFSEKFPMVKWALDYKGWEFDMTGPVPKLVRK